MVEEILQLAPESLFRELAAAGGRGVVDEAVLLRELELRLAATSREAEQLRAVKLALLFGDGGVEQLGAERAHEASLEAARARDHAEGLSVLRHRALVEHLAGGDEVVAELGHQLARAADHRGVAVDAGVHRAAEAVGRRLDEGDLVVGEVDHVQFYAERGGGLTGSGRGEKRRLEGHGLHFGAGVAQHADGELRVESAGN